MLDSKSDFSLSPKEWDHIIELFQKVGSSNASVVDDSVIFLNTMAKIAHNGYYLI